MWQVAKYLPTTLFSLRPFNATTSGGKTLVTSTPYALKMALLDVAIRVHGKSAGALWFPRMRDLKVAVRIPEHLVVNNTFIKILRPHKAGPRDTLGTGLLGPMGNTIAYRELVYLSGPLWLMVIYRTVRAIPISVCVLVVFEGCVIYEGFEIMTGMPRPYGWCSYVG